MDNDSYGSGAGYATVQEASSWRKAWRWLLNDQSLLVFISFCAILAANAGVDIVVVVLLWAILVYLVSNRKVAPPPDVIRFEEPVVQEVDPFLNINAAMASLDMPIYVLDHEAAVRSQNQPAIHVFGEFPEGAHVSARLRAPGILDMVRETIATGMPNMVEHSERVPNELNFQVRIAPLVLPAQFSHRGPFFVLSFRDISESRRLDRMRSDFVANASHELRTPLASVRGFIETLQGPAKDDPKVHERFLGIMLEQVTRMTRMVDDLLSLSRLELKAQIPPVDKVELNTLLGHVKDSLSPLATELGVEIHLEVPEHAVLVTGDRDELTEVFENLIENACKYGQEGKRVDVVLSSAPDGQADVVVRDYGPGIPEEHLPRLTERFYRANVEASRSKKGTGLGLAIVKHILTRHRARLIVKSELQKGSSFMVRF